VILRYRFLYYVRHLHFPPVYNDGYMIDYKTLPKLCFKANPQLKYDGIRSIFNKLLQFI
jgi:hypothetical protein